MLATGSPCGTLVPTDWDRRLTYAGAGLTNTIGVFVLLAANRPSIYITGTVLYLLTKGFCWARFTALQVEIVGQETRDASTPYSVLNSRGSIPLLFMIWLDGVGFRRFGAHGLLWTDAAGNLLMFAVVAVVFLACGLSFRSPSTSQALKSNAATS